MLLLIIPNTFWNGFEVVNINIYYIKNFFKLKINAEKGNAPLLWEVIVQEILQIKLKVNYDFYSWYSLPVSSAMYEILVSLSSSTVRLCT